MEPLPFFHSSHTCTQQLGPVSQAPSRVFIPDPDRSLLTHSCAKPGHTYSRVSTFVSMQQPLMLLSSGLLSPCYSCPKAHQGSYEKGKSYQLLLITAKQKLLCPGYLTPSNIHEEPEWQPWIYQIIRLPHLVLFPDGQQLSSVSTC